MKYLSTNHNSPKATLRQAVLQGLAPDGGLYLPEKIAPLSATFFKKITAISLQEIAIQIAKSFFKNEIPATDLTAIVNNSLNLEIPLKQLDERLYVLELFHGPTLAFKDIGARFMAHLFAYLNDQKNAAHDARLSSSDSAPPSKIIILAATSGDTGSAVGQAFFNLPGFQVFLLYPSGKVSQLQEKQLTTIGGNVTALEIEGTFDDCQSLVKQAFQDAELQTHLRLTSANSINIARLLPQSFYYFYAYAQLLKNVLPRLPCPKKKLPPIVISVPCGNLGNLTAGLLAKKLGLPIANFIAATNRNSIFSNYLQTGRFHPQAAQPTISNAMDVGNPSNFARILSLYHNDHRAICRDIEGCSFSDAQTRAAIQEVHKLYNYIFDPHSTVAYLGLKKYQQTHADHLGIIISTAHPAKFADIVEPIINKKIPLPAALQQALTREKSSVLLSSRYPRFKRFLLSSLP